MKYVKQYVRDKKRNRIGLITAEVKDNCVLIGYSKCSKNDKFDRETGEIIANVRARSLSKVTTLPDELPHDIKKALPGFIKNHAKTLSGAAMPSWIGRVVFTEKGA